MTWRTGELGPEHDCAGFHSGHATLDEWLRRHALRSQHQDVTRTYVWTATGDLEVVAYYSIQPTQVTAADVSRGVAGGHSIVPGYLLARLALDRRLQGRGLGRQLLRNALETCVNAAATGAGRVIVVDAIDEAARDFYVRHGFSNTKTDSHRLVMKVATARAGLRLGANP